MMEAATFSPRPSIQLNDGTIFLGSSGSTLKFLASEFLREILLKLYPRSGLGFKYRLQLNNTVGVIDSDYFGAKNEGHIMLKLTNDSNEGKILAVNAGDAVAQGVFMPFGITVDDDASAIREGGFGSTSGK